MRTLKLWTFSSHASFMTYQKDIGMPLPPGVGAYYRPNNQWITLFEQPGSTSGGQANRSDFNTNKVAHEGFHQLMHTYAKVMLEKQTGGEILWTSPEVRSRRLWLQEGFAELMAGAMAAGDQPWSLASVLSRRVKEIRMTLGRDFSAWSLEELLGIRGRSDMLRRCYAKARARGNMADTGRLSSLVYAQSWALCHFLWNAGDGKYREKFLEALHGEMTGKANPADWVDVWTGGEDQPDHEAAAHDADPAMPAGDAPRDDGLSRRRVKCHSRPSGWSPGGCGWR